MKKKNIVLFVLLLLIVLMYSCNSENPVDSEYYNFDMPRFDWKMTEIPGISNGDFCTSIWSLDTNEVFLCNLSGNRIFHFKDGQINQINFGSNIRISRITGLSKNEAYALGVEIVNGKYKPHLEKWNGNSFVNIPLIYNSDDDFSPSQIYVKNSNEIWISSSKGLIYKFNGSNLIKYQQTDTLMLSMGIIYDEENQLRHLTAYFTPDTSVKWYIYDFDGNDWSKKYEDESIRYWRFYGIFKNSIYAHSENTIYKIQDNTLIPKVKTTKTLLTYDVQGNKFENIMSFAERETGKGFYHWNGVKWSSENVKNVGHSSYFLSKMVNDEYYCAINTDSDGRSTLYRAFKKL